MKGVINTERGGCRLNVGKDINSKEQKKEIREKITEEIQRQWAWKRSSDGEGGGRYEVKI